MNSTESKDYDEQQKGLLAVSKKKWTRQRDIERDSTRASLDVLMGRITTSWERTPGSLIHVSLGISIGGVLIRTEGKKTTNLDVEPATDSSMMLYLGGEGELSFIINTLIWIPITAKVGTFPQDIKINFAEERVAEYGLPIVELGAGITFRLGQ